MLAVHIRMFVYNLTAFIVAFICIQKYILSILSSYVLSECSKIFIHNLYQVIILLTQCTYFLIKVGS
jgi:hypothetical protein